MLSRTSSFPRAVLQPRLSQTDSGAGGWDLPQAMTHRFSFVATMMMMMFLFFGGAHAGNWCEREDRTEHTGSHCRGTEDGHNFIGADDLCVRRKTSAAANSRRAKLIPHSQPVVCFPQPDDQIGGGLFSQCEFS